MYSIKAPHRELQLQNTLQNFGRRDTRSFQLLFATHSLALRPPPVIRGLDDKHLGAPEGAKSSVEGLAIYCAPTSFLRCHGYKTQMLAGTPPKTFLATLTTL